MTFPEFFHALWGYDPFPWQKEVAERVLRGEWPRIGLPTAAGKTALIDIALYALAKGAPAAARRIFFVVDRRLIVDEAAERAGKIAKKLQGAEPDSALGRVAQSLLELGGAVPLETARLRGGIPQEDSWPDSPLQPLVACSTVDQIGSSLLFQAYGASEYARPIRAGLSANDALILLDEAHTSRPFARTLELIARYRAPADSQVGLPFTVVEMSATSGMDAVCESEADIEHELLKRRWEASKRARLVAVEPKDEDLTGLVEGLAREARGLRDGRAKVIGVIANRVRTARRVHGLLSSDEGSDAILLIGRSRPHDRDQIWQEWKERIALGRETQSERPVFVVATQCIEVGANLDFDCLVTEVASIDALEQRFGRLDRDGKRGPTKAAIVAQKDQIAKKYEDRLYGAAMAATWAWLTDHAVKQKAGKAREQVAARQWLSGGKSGDLADVEGGAQEISRREPGRIPPVLWWRGVDESEAVDRAEAIRPGMTIVVPSDRGGCDRWGWNPESTDKVFDIGDAVKLAVGRPMLRLHPELARQWNYVEMANQLRPMNPPTLEEAAAVAWVAEAIKALRGSRQKWIADPQKDAQWCAVVSRPAFDQNDVRGSYGSVEVPLAEHMKNCAAVAEGFARGLPSRLRRTLVRAAEAHDLGKADPRFQAWLRGGNPVKTDELIAKSAKNGQNRAAIERARQLAGYPKGARHELLSVALLITLGDGGEDLDWDLLLHLVASHHGRCRPFAPVVVDEDPVTVEYGGVEISSAHGLERVGSGVSERFWRLTRRYGWYGLAYLEAIVRLADQRQSEAEQSRQSGKAAHV